MTYRLWICDESAMLDVLNNALKLGPFPRAGLAVGGRTVIFSEPVETVTFPGALDDEVSLSDIAAEIRSTVADIHVEFRKASVSPDFPNNIRQSLVLFLDTGATIAETGTANALLGLSDTEETIILPPVSLDAVKSVSNTGPGKYTIIAGGDDANFADDDVFVVVP